MNRFLLLSLSAASAISLAATQHTDTEVPLRQVKPVETVTVNRVAHTAFLQNLGKKTSVKSIRPDNSRFAIKQLDLPLNINRTINPASRARKVKAAAAPGGVSFFESFEGHDGTDPTWLPEGWSIDSNSGRDITPAETWGISAPGAYGMPDCPDGKFYMGITFNADYLDESLVTPWLTVGAGENLTFEAMVNPLFLFSTNNVDWETNAFIGDKIPAATLQVRIQEEGGEWVTLWDAQTPYLDYTYDQLMAASAEVGYDLIPRHVSLSDYEGKRVRIGFRYVGTDGNTMFIDAVKIGLPSLEGVAYMNPFETTYFGMSEDMRALLSDYALYPVHAPVTWFNNSNNYDATYSWTYCDPADASWITSTESDLTVTYRPDYTSEFSTNNNFFYPPVLTGSLEGSSDATYTKPYSYFQAGGRPDFTVSGERVSFGMLPFMVANDDLTAALVDYDNYRLYTPIFGKSPTTQKYWTEITKNGQEDEDLTVSVTALYNFVYPASSPLVVRGARVFATGKMDPSTVLTFDIVPLNDDYTKSDEVLATATATGEALNTSDPNAITYMHPVFTFDHPVVLDNSHVGYIARLRGFDAESVEYFAPMQGARPNEDYLCHGYVTKNIVWNGDERESEYPIAYETNEYGDMYTGFAITLDAEYPWLVAETDAVELVDGGVSVKLDSFYDGADLTVTAPAGAVATVTGRYGDCRLDIVHDDTAVIAQGKVTVSGPGVKAELDLTQNSSITSVSADALTSVAAEAYPLTGARVDVSSSMAPGLYIVRHTDGTVRKVAVK